MALEIPFFGSDHTPVVSLEKPGNSHGAKASKMPKPSTESFVGICNKAIGLMSAAVVTLCRCGSPRRKMRQTPGTVAPGDSRDRGFEMKGEAPMSRLGRVLSKLRPGQRSLAAQEASELPGDTAHPGDMPGNGIHELYVAQVGLGTNEYFYGDGTSDLRTEGARAPSPYELAAPDTRGQVQGRVPAWVSSVDEAEKNVSLVGQYRPDDASLPVPMPFEMTTAMPSMPLPTMSRPSDMQDRRFNVPSPLIIVPHTTSVSLARSPSDATSTYMPYSPYEYYSHPIVSSLPSSLSNDDIAPSFRYGPRSLHSSNSNRSSQPHSPASSQSTGPAPSMSRSISTGKTDSRSLPPPTPPYLQSQRAPIDSENIICLGSLPDNMPLPSLPPNHLQLRSQSSWPAPRAVNPDGQDRPPMWPTALHQDPLLHDSSPLPPYKSPVTPVFTREHSLHAHRHRGEDDRYLGADPRRSTDSLGSNFTVEEEARIQAQIVRNLSMLGQERVGGEGDIVHIPQPSERRFSFEDDR